MMTRTARCTRSFGAAPSRWVLALALMVVGSALAPTGAAARPENRYYAGFGLSEMNLHGGPDGTVSYTLHDSLGYPAGPIVSPGKLERAPHGINLVFGFVYNRYLGVEYGMHAADVETTHEQYPREILPATVRSSFLALRGMWPLHDDVELFGRLAFGTISVAYANNARWTPYSARFGSTLTGNLSAEGGGVVFFFGAAGFELGANRWHGSLGRIEAGDDTESIPGLAFGVLELTLSATYHFGGPPPGNS